MQYDSANDKQKGAEKKWRRASVCVRHSRRVNRTALYKHLARLKIFWFLIDYIPYGLRCLLRVTFFRGAFFCFTNFPVARSNVSQICIRWFLMTGNLERYSWLDVLNGEHPLNGWVEWSILDDCNRAPFQCLSMGLAIAFLNRIERWPISDRVQLHYDYDPVFIWRRRW